MTTPLQRQLAAFEAPDDASLTEPLAAAAAYEAAWNRWVDDLTDRRLQIVADLDPVATVGSIEIYEVVSL